MTLVLPSLFSELQGDALPAIVEQLAAVPYLSEIVIGLETHAQLSTRSKMLTCRKI